ncbi:hypothetical protein [Streptomyces vinaceus]|uniref:hypothetical protein n=1 Tax=Streptomyces vinaceus TaxID=1960 RepID=UPI0036A97AA8
MTTPSPGDADWPYAAFQNGELFGDLLDDGSVMATQQLQDPFHLFDSVGAEVWQWFEGHLEALSPAADPVDDGVGQGDRTRVPAPADPVAVSAAVAATAAQIPHLTAALPTEQARQWMAGALLGTEETSGDGNTSRAVREALADIAGPGPWAAAPQPYEPAFSGEPPVSVSHERWLLDPAIPGGLALPVSREDWVLDPALPQGLSLPAPPEHQTLAPDPVPPGRPVPAAPVHAPPPVPPPSRALPTRTGDQDPGPPPAAPAAHKRPRETSVDGAPNKRPRPDLDWLLSAALSPDPVPTLLENGRATGDCHYKHPTSLYCAIVRLGRDRGLEGRGTSVREQLKAQLKDGTISDPGTYRRYTPAPAGDPDPRGLPTTSEGKWLLTAILCRLTDEEIASRAKRSGLGLPTDPEGLRAAVRFVAGRLGAVGDDWTCRQILQEWYASGRIVHNGQGWTVPGS